MPDKCPECGKSDEEVDIVLAPDPYQSEINGNDEEVWLCTECRKDKAGDI